MHRYPADTSTSAEIALAALSEHLPAIPTDAAWHDWWQALSSAARGAAEATPPEWANAKALWLMADACSMMLKPESVNEPFGPFMVIDGSRSAIPEDFSIEDAQLFSQVAEGVNRPKLRARLSDVAWLCAKPKNIADARRAIDAYTEIEPTEDNWVDAHSEWERAISLCMQLRKGAEGRLERIEDTLVRIGRESLPLPGGLGLAATRLLFDRRLARDQGDTFAEALAKRGSELVSGGGDYFRARSYLDLAGQWFSRLGQPERAADMTLALALSWEAEADQRINADPSAGHLVGTSFLDDAIQTLRKIPKAQRQARNVDQHLNRILRRLPESGQLALKAMATIQSGTIDITEFIEQAEKAVAGKPTLQALLTLAHIHQGASFSVMAERAKKSLREHPFSAMFAASYYDSDGRVIAKTAGGDLDRELHERDPKVWSTIMRDHQMNVDLVCKAQILPALATIRAEHTIRKADLAQLMSQSPIVPPGRAEQFAKGLWEGFEHDFATAIFVLAPQIEHLVRWHLKQSGVSTTNVDANGVENEVGLSSLVEAPEVKGIFGEDVAFELEALFCTPFGPNLRNVVAHGLLNTDECGNTGVIYAWWWILRLTLSSFLKQLRARAASQSADNGGEANG